MRSEKLSGLLLSFDALPWAAAFAAQTDDTEYEARAVDYINTYLAAHPLQGNCSRPS